MRMKIFLGTLLLFILSTIPLFAQTTLPCADGDPDNPCPLDTWVIVLAFAAIFFAAKHLNRKQSALTGALQ